VVLPPVDPSQPLPEPAVVQLLDPTAEELTSLYQIGFAAAEMQRFNLGDRMFQIQQSVVPVPTGTEISEGKGVEGKAPPPVPQPSPTNRWGVWSSSSGDFVNLDGTSAAKATGSPTLAYLLGLTTWLYPTISPLAYLADIPIPG